MRQRRFRIWDCVLKKMIYPEIFSKETKEKYASWSAVELVSALRFYDAIGGQSELMDWTGTETKEEVDIYEGDKLLLDLSWDESGIHYPSSLHGKIGEVVYEGEHGGWIVQCEYNNRTQDYLRLDCDIAFTSKIVGHIFENKER